MASSPAPDSSWEIRPARPGDEQRLRALRLAALADAPEFFCSRLEDERAEPPEFWEGRVARGANLLGWPAGAAPDSDPLGMVACVPAEDASPPGVVAGTVADAEARGGEGCGATANAPNAQAGPLHYLVAMYVAPPARGKGLGDALVTAAIDRASAAGAGALALHVTEGNATAQALYERHGFQLTGDLFVLERTGERELEMRRVMEGRSGCDG